MNSSSNLNDSDTSDELESLGSISSLINRYKQNDDSAAAIELWQRYFTQLCDVAKSRFSPNQAFDADEEDAAVMAFYAMLDGFTNGRFQGVNKRDDFWRLLVAITNRNISKIRRRNKQLKRGGGHTRSATPAEELHDEADAQAIVDLSDTIRSVVSSLPSERYQRVFFLRAAGHSIDEIVIKTGQSKRTVARQLDMIRQIWSKQD